MVTDRMSDDYTPTLAEARERFAKQYPDLPADPDDLAAFDRMIESVRADHEKEKADAWAEGYRSGVNDERTAASLGRPAEPNRNNPWREKGGDR